ncbi:hypothetical protein DFP74_0725 [Nocardiopsis sp. Huas11]|uniref:hypothetical protein n=1 Tax=Nocardiopsis sp. Huas11 TaxID=2183912 RepID=UPI000F28EFC0|nr:hypothetical protein [Nocardiopsis sp. Huas11]RKS05134.1 hypothetical protein DFP74_0725 [Nocardiopsis sp. Huas11]
MSEHPDGSGDTEATVLSPEALADAVGLALVAPPAPDTDDDLVLRLRALLRAALHD